MARNRIDQSRADLDLARGSNRSFSGQARQPLELHDRLRGGNCAVAADVHRRRAGMVGSSFERDVPMHVSCDRAHHAEPVTAVLKDPPLLDMQFDPADQMIEDVCTLSPTLGVVPGLLGVLPERAAVVEGQDPLAQVEFVHPNSHDPTTQHHLPKSRRLLLEKRDRLQGKIEPQLEIEATDLECGDHTERSVPFSPLRFESQCEPMPNACSPIALLRATKFPTGSSYTVKPRSRHAEVK